MCFADPLIATTHYGFGKHEAAEGDLEDMIYDTQGFFKLL